MRLKCRKWWFSRYVMLKKIKKGVVHSVNKILLNMKASLLLFYFIFLKMHFSYYIEERNLPSAPPPVWPVSRKQQIRWSHSSGMLFSSQHQSSPQTCSIISHRCYYYNSAAVNIHWMLSDFNVCSMMQHLLISLLQEVHWVFSLSVLKPEPLIKHTAEQTPP